MKYNQYHKIEIINTVIKKKQNIPLTSYFKNIVLFAIVHVTR